MGFQLLIRINTQNVILIYEYSMTFLYFFLKLMTLGWSLRRARDIHRECDADNLSGIEIRFSIDMYRLRRINLLIFRLKTFFIPNSGLQ
jgi:hypothetical protein